MAENPVQVDHEELTAEAESIPLPEGAPPPLAGEGAVPEAELVTAQPTGSWASSTPTVVYLVDKFVCPNWQLTEPEKSELTGAMTPVLDDLFPGGLGSEKWAPYFRLVGVAGTIAIARMENGKLKPLREKKNGEPAADPDEIPAGVFTTAAGAGSH